MLSMAFRVHPKNLQQPFILDFFAMPMNNQYITCCQLLLPTSATTFCYHLLQLTSATNFCY
jgi:hypothetical protein